ncbi:hypothetical protein PanWU01x14_105120 [Parasponia andersonii]|uniref:Uncharacterized protein n=1 Tax=Parasponia andersonii TaxID=3476 RepID=A0A2P5D1K6_PARAD|nr:hypothetical protein PanWU01x14_105120 [Parasponia andersonii]
MEEAVRQVFGRSWLRSASTSRGWSTRLRGSKGEDDEVDILHDDPCLFEVCASLFEVLEGGDDMLTGSSSKITLLFFTELVVFSFPFPEGGDELVETFDLEQRVDGGAHILPLV